MSHIWKISNLRRSFLFMVMSMFFPLASPAQAVDWTISTIDSIGDVVGFSNSIAVDSNEKVHIAYVSSDGGNRNLKYATNASGDWVTSTIDSGDVGWHSSAAVDSNNHVHISYYTATNDTLKYATNASGDWVTSTIDAGGVIGIDETHIAVDSHNKLHICYHGSIISVGDVLQYVTNTSGDWVTSIIDSGEVGLHSSIASDSKNKLHISYLAGTDGILKYATNASGHWVKSVIDRKKGTGFNTSIAVDSNNKVHISYCDSIDISLKYATNASGHWVKSMIDRTDYVGSTSIAVDSNSKVAISYGSQYLQYATNASGHWVISSIDYIGDLGGFPSMEVDSDNKVHISYYDSTNHDLKYAVNHPVELLSPNGGETISAGSTYSITWSAPSEAVNFRLMYSVNNGKTWRRIHSSPYITGLSYNWTVPTPAHGGDKWLVKITGFDVNRKKVGVDMSDSTFTIEL
jgi:hypothetical protein